MDLPWWPRRCRDTETGEVYEPRWITHKDLNPDANEFDAGLFDVGVPYQIDDLITGKRYRRKIQAIIRRGGLRYLLAAAEIARAAETPAAYFATMTAKKNWPGTKATIIRTGAHSKYAELDEDYEVSPGSPYYRQSFTILAAEWIVAALTANGPMRSSDFSAKAKADGIYRSEGTFSGARKLAGVQTGRAGGQCWWVWLPGQERPVDHPDGPDGRCGGGELAAESPAPPGVGLDRPISSNSQREFNSQGIEGLSIGVGIPGDVPPLVDPEHYPRFARSCVLSSTQAEFDAVPASRRLHKKLWQHVSPRELDELLDAFDPAADELGPCALWTGTTDKDGYAVFKAGGRQYRAHRWLWTLRHGPIAPGLEIAHHTACPHRKCVIHVTPETKKKNLAERRKPRPRGQAQARRDEIRAARFREEQREYWSKPQAQREAEHRAGHGNL